MHNNRNAVHICILAEILHEATIRDDKLPSGRRLGAFQKKLTDTGAASSPQQSTKQITLTQFTLQLQLSFSTIMMFLFFIFFIIHYYSSYTSRCLFVFSLIEFMCMSNLFFLFFSFLITYHKIEPTTAPLTILGE